MKTPPPTFHVYWGRITFAAAAAFAIASIPAFFNGQWGRLAAGAALAAIGALIAVLFFNLGHAAARAERAFQVEAARGTKTNDPDPFAEQLRVHPDTDTTGDNQ